MADLKERYLGNDVYAQWDDPSWVYSNQIKLTKQEWSGDELKRLDSIFLEPLMLYELVRYACDIGWRHVVQGGLGSHMTDEEYAAAEEDAQRKRDAKEGFE